MPTSNPPSRAPGLIAALLLLAATWVGALVAYRAAPPAPADAPAAAFSAARAIGVLRELLAESVPHPLGSAANAVVRERIVARLRALGYEPELESRVLACDRYAACGTPANIVVRIPGADATAGSLLLAAHYDSVPAGPGASDDGTGVAIVLEIARLLKSRPAAHHPLVLLITDGEELGMLGAAEFTHHHAFAKDVKAAVNVDTRGTSGPSLMFETGTANAWLMRLYAGAIARPLTNSVYYAVYKSLPNNTDFTEFKDAGYQGFNFATIGGVAHYHTPSDDLAHVDARSVQAQGDNDLALWLALDASDVAHATPGEAAYFDVFGAVLVRLPRSLLLPSAIATALLALAVTLLMVRRRVIGGRELAWGLGLQLTVTAGAAALAQGLVLALGFAAPRGLPEFSAYPAVLQCTFAGLAAVLLATLGCGLRRRVCFWGLWCAHALWTAALASVLAAKLPGASYPLLLPAMGSLLALVARLGGKLESRLGHDVAALGLLLVTFTLLWPIVLPLYAALGATALPLLSVLLVWGAAPLAALLTEAGRGARWVFIAGAVAVVLVGGVLALLMPAFTVDSPEPLNIKYLIDRANAGGSRRARWLVTPASGQLPAPFRRVQKFAAPAEPLSTLIARKDATVFAAPAPLVDLPPPQLTLLSATVSTEPPPQRHVHYRFHLASPRAAAVLQIAFAPAAHIRDVSVSAAGADAVPVGVSLYGLEDDWRQLRLVGGTAQGVDLECDAADVPLAVRVLDLSAGLPPAGRALLDARPADTTPIQNGDVTLVSDVLEFLAPK